MIYTLNDIARSCATWDEWVRESAANTDSYDARTLPASYWPDGRQTISRERLTLMNLREQRDRALRFDVSSPNERDRIHYMVENTVQEVGEYLDRWERWLDTNVPAPPLHPPGWVPPLPPPPPPPPAPTPRPNSEIVGMIGCGIGAMMMIAGLLAGLENPDPNSSDSNPGAPIFFIGLGVIVVLGYYWVEGSIRRTRGDRAANIFAASVGAASVAHIAYRHHQHHEAQQRQALAQAIAQQIQGNP